MDEYDEYLTLDAQLLYAYLSHQADDQYIIDLCELVIEIAGAEEVKGDLH